MGSREFVMKKKRKNKKPIELVGRRTWEISPVTRIKPNKKKKTRQRCKSEVFKYLEENGINGRN